MKKINIKLQDSSYPIFYSSIENEGDKILKNYITCENIAIITDENASKICLEKLKYSLKDIEANIIEIILRPGEENKCLSNAGQIIDKLLKKNFERSDTIIALGGGVIGDLAGFVSAIIHRGVNFINIPTTLLAQVDSAIGGKTGVNSNYGKNLIGSFKQPQLVICDTDFLKSLPRREFYAGYAELVKHSLIFDENLFLWLDKVVNELPIDSEKLEEAIYRSASIKANIVMVDVKEKNYRAFLNLGHTFGHAIETIFNYDGTILHGEAVSIGIILAYKLSHSLNICSSNDYSKVKKHFIKAGLKIDLKGFKHNNLKSEKIIELMKNDKKVKKGSINFIIPKKIGEVSIKDGIEQKIIKSAIDTALPS